MQRALPSSRGQRGDCDLGAAGPSSHTPAIPGRGSRPEGCFCRRGKGSWRALGGVWAPWESRGCWRAASAPRRVTPPSPPPPSPVSPPIPGPRTKGMASTHLVERRHWVLSRYSGEPGRARGLDVPHPVGDQCPRKDPLSWHLRNEAARRHGRGSGRYREGPGKARDGTESLCSLLGWIVTEHECALRAMTTPDTPPLPAHMQWKSRGKWAGRLSRVSSFHIEDRNGHSRGQGLPLTEALGQPLLSDQACLRQDCHITGGCGVGMGSDSQELGTQGPRFPQGFPGASVWEAPCPLTPLPTCLSPGPSPPSWPPGWATTLKISSSPQNFPA